MKVERSVKQAGGAVTLGPLQTARKGIATRTLPIPAAMVEDVRAHCATTRNWVGPVCCSGAPVMVDR